MTIEERFPVGAKISYSNWKGERMLGVVTGHDTNCVVVRLTEGEMRNAVASIDSEYDHLRLEVPYTLADMDLEEID